MRTRLAIPTCEFRRVGYALAEGKLELARAMLQAFEARLAPPAPRVAKVPAPGLALVVPAPELVSRTRSPGARCSTPSPATGRSPSARA